MPSDIPISLALFLPKYVSNHCFLVRRVQKIGILTGMSLVNGGSWFSFFAPAMYRYVCGKDISSIEIGETNATWFLLTFTRN